MAHTTPQVGDIAPLFTLPTQRGVMVSLSDALEQGRAVAIAFVGRVRLDGKETPVQRRVRAMTNDHARIVDNRILLLAIVANRREEAKRYVEETGTPFHLLCDEDGAVARRYGLARWSWSFVLRRDIKPALFGVDPDGRVGYCRIGEFMERPEWPDAS